MFVAARNLQEISWAHTLFACFIFPEVSAFENNDLVILRVYEHSRVVPWRSRGDTCRNKSGFSPPSRGSAMRLSDILIVIAMRRNELAYSLQVFAD